MPLFLCLCEDASEGPQLRARELAAHLAHVESHMERYAVAGPLKRDGQTIGSTLIVKADGKADARAFLERDPYAKAGVWQSIRIDEFAAVAGEWVGGAAWNDQ